MPPTAGVAEIDAHLSLAVRHQAGLRDVRREAAHGRLVVACGEADEQEIAAAD